jgi:hypothetical protein
MAAPSPALERAGLRAKPPKLAIIVLQITSHLHREALGAQR